MIAEAAGKILARQPLDLPQTLQAEAAQEQKAAVAFTQCDMAAMEFDEGYDAAYCVGSSFGFFDDGRNAEVARRIDDLDTSIRTRVLY